MKTYKISIKITFAWWVTPYLHALHFFSWITGLQPDEKKVEAKLQTGARLKTTVTEISSEEAPS